MAAPGIDDHLVVGRYARRELLGRGGFGTVWRAHDTLLLRDVAVKEVEFPAVLSDEERTAVREKVLREARAAARLNHPALVTVFDVAEEDGRPVIVMELVDAPDLAQIVAAEGPIPEGRAAAIGIELLDALAVAHEQGIVHRDVKPANVMVSDAGRVQLGDFGIASIIDDPRVTSSGQLAGSPSYMAPEQAQNRPASEATDLWGLGATLYFAVEGSPPFEKNGAIATLTSLVMDEPRPMQRAHKLAPLLQDLLVKSPEGRPTVAETRQRLRQVATSATPVQDRSPTERFDADALAHAMAATSGPEPDGAAEDPGGAEESDGDPTEAASLAALLAEPDEIEPPATAPPSTAPIRSEPSDSAAPTAAAAPAPTAITPNQGPAPTREAAPTATEVAPPPPPPTGPPAAPPPRKPASAGPRRAPAVAAVVIVVAVIAAALWLGGDRDGTDTATRQSSSTTALNDATDDAAAADAEDVDDASSAPPQTAAPARPQPPAESRADGVPRDWVAYEDPATGYQVSHPPTWTVSVNGTLTDFRDPRSGAYLRVDFTNEPGPSPVQAWYDFEPRFAAENPNYERIRIEPTTFKGFDAAIWEFTYTGLGTDLRAADLGFVTDSHGFALNFQTPAGAWDDMQDEFEAFQASFEPPDD